MLIAAARAAHARELLLSGEPVSPARAWEVGLVHEPAAPEQVPERTPAPAHTLAAKPGGRQKVRSRS